ncbi:RNA polymerase sigma factor [Herpetosiphon geysericola]|uniref:RNA polymerase sigma-70 region 2 domain-containing protein n=1 Tax=Herpetosiphon geysericola TaxID=70996 RepID=A0A0P6Y2T7_9CHLR|nr:sigma-70 family RNA polymerase sigma factor [Herpetosiphon geysericola]KPL86179.1 hypothetical protein SE18_15095 [Herpetosiphon geysericola]
MSTPYHKDNDQDNILDATSSNNVSSLSPSEIEEYSKSINIPQNFNKKEIERIIMNYHREHKMIESLINRDNYDHLQQWNNLYIMSKNFVDKYYNEIFDLNEIRRYSEDIVQDIMLNIYNGLDGFRYYSRFKTWFYKVSINTILQDFRKRGSISRIGDYRYFYDSEYISYPDNSDEIIDNIFMDNILSSLKEAPDERLQQVARLYFIEDKNIYQISSILNIGKSRIHQLLQMARSLLQDQVRLNYTDDLDLVKFDQSNE